jgi:hypothetical protein
VFPAYSWKGTEAESVLQRDNWKTSPFLIYCLFQAKLGVFSQLFNPPKKHKEVCDLLPICGVGEMGQAQAGQIDFLLSERVWGKMPSCR